MQQAHRVASLRAGERGICALALDIASGTSDVKKPHVLIPKLLQRFPVHRIATNEAWVNGYIHPQLGGLAVSRPSFLDLYFRARVVGWASGPTISSGKLVLDGGRDERPYAVDAPRKRP